MTSRTEQLCKSVRHVRFGWQVALVALLALVLGACSSTDRPGDSDVRGSGASGGVDRTQGSQGSEQGTDPAREPGPVSWPAAPPVRVCGNQSILGNGPTSPPAGAVVVPAGNNSAVDFTRPGETYWFAPGTHTLGTDEFGQIIPADHATYVGAPGAVLDGQKRNKYAFTQKAEGVTIEYLTIADFGPRGDNNNEGVVNHDSGANWTIRNNTIRDNAGAGMMLGSGNVVRHNCVTRNGQYGFNAYSATGPVDITMDRNELSYNNTFDWEAKVDGCGCTGGGKFWSVTRATVTNNYVHDNKGVGLWADNNNRGFLFENNYVSNNDDVGIFYETSYNAVIRNNTIVGNARVWGPKDPGFPTGGIYVSESGADNRVSTRYNNRLEITGNLLKNNWSGVVLWENADRFCGSPNNTSTGECTLVNPGVVTARSCDSANVSSAPYYRDCRWRTQNVKVHHNTFVLDPSKMGAECTFANSCGLSGIFSNFGTSPDWSPYKGRVVEDAITHRQDNTFSDNTYRGRWAFLALDQGNLVSFAQWQGAPFEQDAGSTLN